MDILSSSPMGLLSSFWIVFEFTVGIACVICRHRRLCWAVACLAFSSFAAIATWKAYSGVFDCGCFGRLQLPPAFVAVFDSCVVAALLLIGRWNFPQGNIGWRLGSLLNRISVVGFAIVAALSTHLALVHTSLLGEANRILPQAIVVPRSSVGEASAELIIVNRLGVMVEDMKLLPSCGCTLSKLGCNRLSPGERGKLAIRIQGEKSQQEFRMPIELQYYVEGKRQSDFSYLVSDRLVTN